MSILTDKIDYLMKYREIDNYRKLSELSKIPYTTIRNIYNRNSNNIGKKTLNSLANFFNVSTEYLTDDNIQVEDIIIRYKKNVIIDSSEFKRAIMQYFNKQKDYQVFEPESVAKKLFDESNLFPAPDEIKRLPVIGKISAGLPILAVENIIDYAFAPSSYIKDNYTYFYLLVQGDSMNLKFNNGDYILVQQQDTLENDEIGVFLIEDEATVKRYKAEDGIIKLFPMSTNPKHEAQFYDPHKVKIKIIGKVISYQGKV